MKRTISRVTATAFVASCLTIIGTPIASADGSSSTQSDQKPIQLNPAISLECSVGDFFLYRLKDYTGGCWEAKDSDWLSFYSITNGCITWDYDSTNCIDNSPSSMANKTSRTIKLYDLENWGGIAYTALPYSEDSDLSSNSGNPSFDNKASSMNY